MELSYVVATNQGFVFFAASATNKKWDDSHFK